MEIFELTYVVAEGTEINTGQLSYRLIAPTRLLTHAVSWVEQHP